MAYVTKININTYDNFKIIYSKICQLHNIPIAKDSQTGEIVFKALSRKNHSLNYKLYSEEYKLLSKEEQRRLKRHLGRKQYKEKYKHNCEIKHYYIGQIYQTSGYSIYIKASNFNNIMACIRQIEKIVNLNIIDSEFGIEYIKLSE